MPSWPNHTKKREQGVFIQEYALFTEGWCVLNSSLHFIKIADVSNPLEVVNMISLISAIFHQLSRSNLFYSISTIAEIPCIVWILIEITN